MKFSSTTILFLLLFISVEIHSQSCISGDVVFSNQTELDDFVTAHSSSGCTDIDGNLTILDCSDMSGLSFLNTIIGSLTIEDYSGSNLLGMENIISVGSDIYLRNNYMTDISQLNGIQTIHGDFTIYSHKVNIITGYAGLTDVGGLLQITSSTYQLNGNLFPSLEVVDSSIIINNNANIVAIEFPELTFIGGELRFQFCYDLTSIALPKLTEVSSQFTITVCENLYSISGPLLANLGGLQMSNISELTTIDFPSLEFIEGDLSITSNSNLTSMSGFSQLNTVGGEIYLYNMNGLLNLDGLELLEEVNDRIYISNNSLLNEISSLQSLIHIETSLYLSNLSSLTNIETPLLTNCPRVDLRNLPLLNDISALNSITDLDYIYFVSLPLVTDVSMIQVQSKMRSIYLIGMDLVTDISFLNIVDSVGTLGFSDLSLLESTPTFSNLTSAWRINLHKLPKVINLSGFSALENIDFDLTIEEIGAKTLDGFENLRQIGNDLTIEDNDSLIDVSAFSNLKVIGNDLDVVSNDSLSDCCIFRNFISKNDAFLGGEITINNNLDECLPGYIIINCSSDGIKNTEDNCLEYSNPDQVDQDNDNIGDVCDNCPTISNPNQEDLDMNGIGDVCELLSGKGSGYVSIGGSEPKSKLQIKQGDIYLENIHRGIILKSANGACFRIQPNEEGELISKSIACPN